MQAELGIGMRRITVSTVGIVPNIAKLAIDLPQVRLAVSLHCATDVERSALLPANARYGGLDSLMQCLRDDYVKVTGRRVTLEWALISGQNDTVETARALGQLLVRHQLRRDLLHVNVIPLNPTAEFGGKASQRHAVDRFCETLEREFGVSSTPRVRRGIDIDAGCGQLSNKITTMQNNNNNNDSDTNQVVSSFSSATTTTTTTTAPTSNRKVTDFVPLGDQSAMEVNENGTDAATRPLEHRYSLEGAVDTDWEDFEDPEFSLLTEQVEAERLLALVQGTTINLSTIRIVGDDCNTEGAKQDSK